MTLPILTISDFIVAASSCGALPTGSIPFARNLSLTSGVAMTRTISSFSRFKMAAATFAGAKTP